jgi:hypothetical protein
MGVVEDPAARTGPARPSKPSGTLDDSAEHAVSEEPPRYSHATEFSGAMKGRIVSAFIYALTALALWYYFDGYYARDLSRVKAVYIFLLHASTAGAWLFAISFVLALLSLRFGIVCALAAGVMAWPYFFTLLLGIPWRHLIDVLPYSDWLAQYISILTLIISSAYSVVQLRMFVRASFSIEPWMQ